MTTSSTRFQAPAHPLDDKRCATIMEIARGLLASQHCLDPADLVTDTNAHGAWGRALVRAGYDTGLGAPRSLLPGATAEEQLQAVFDALGVGLLARSPSTLMTNLANLKRRSACLSALEQAYFPEEESPDESEDDGAVGQHVIDAPSWGAEPAEYVRQFQGAMSQAAEQLPPQEHADLVRDHEVAKAINNLRDVARQFSATQQLRERIVETVLPLVRRLRGSGGPPPVHVPAARALPGAKTMTIAARHDILTEVSQRLARDSTEGAAATVVYMRDHSDIAAPTREALLVKVASRFEYEQFNTSAGVVRKLLAETCPDAHPDSLRHRLS